MSLENATGQENILTLEVNSGFGDGLCQSLELGPGSSLPSAAASGKHTKGVEICVSRNYYQYSPIEGLASTNGIILAPA